MYALKRHKVVATLCHLTGFGKVFIRQPNPCALWWIVVATASHTLVKYLCFAIGAYRLL